MRHIIDVRRVIAECNSCERLSPPVDQWGEPGDKIYMDFDKVFADIMWLVTDDGAWCPDCKGLPR
jgi:hypothetical protein